MVGPTNRKLRLRCLRKRIQTQADLVFHLPQVYSHGGIYAAFYGRV